MAGFIELIAKIKPKNNGKYPLVDDVDVEMEDGSRLSEAIKKPRIPDGGTEGQILAKKSNTNGDVAWVEPLKTEDIDKKLESKLDKNLGSENSDKVLTTDSQGNIITQDKEEFEGGGGTTNYDDLENKPQINGVELNGNKTSGDLKMYTQEEVDDLLYDKMDKPYKPITITDDITIEDCLDGHFKINKILGNTYQAEESDIVPTPQRPIPINSRKTTITKINPNIFDLEKESDTSKIPDSGTYRSIGQHQLKANTKYVFSWSEATVPAKATLSLQIQDDKGAVLVSPFTYFNLEATEKKEAGKEVEFTTNESGIVKFAYNCVVGTSSTTETYQQYWYTKILKDIVLKEDVEYEPEYVELRSLKETINKFDLGLLSQTNLITNSGAYRKIEIPIKLKPNTRYKIYYEKSMIPALTWAVLNIVDNTEKNLVEILNVKNTENNEVEKQAVNLAFTSPADGEIYFSYYVQSYNAEGVLIPQNTETFKEKWFTKILKNIMITEESLNQNTYVPPTIRDYKIVDHANKTSKIVRNVKNIRVTPTLVNNGFNDYTETMKRAIIRTLDRFVIDNVTKAGNDLSNVAITRFGSLQNGNVLANVSGIANMYWYPDISMFGLNGSEIKDVASQKLVEFLTNNEMYVQYQLAIPVEESITYVETDTNEVGYSWQDTTSPSPTIPAEVNGVEEIDIKLIGNNLYNGLYEEGSIDNTSGADTVSSTRKRTFFINVKPLTTYTISNDGTFDIYIIEYDKDKLKTGNMIPAIVANTGNKYKKFTTSKNTNYIKFRNNDNQNFNNIQLEVGDTATAYEPYTEQHVNYTPTNPMYSTQDGSISDYVDVEKGVEVYNMQKYVVTGNELFFQDYQSKSGYYGRYFDLKNGNGILTDKGFCNYLPYVTAVWSSEQIGFCQNEKSQINLRFTNETLGITDDTPVEEKRTAFANYLKQLYASENPLYVVVVVTPTETPIPQEDLKLLKSLKTEQGVTNIFVGGEVKPTIEARYALDIASIVSKLQTKLLTLQEEVVKNV